LAGLLRDVRAVVFAMKARHMVQNGICGRSAPPPPVRDTAQPPTKSRAHYKRDAEEPSQDEAKGKDNNRARPQETQRKEKSWSIRQRQLSGQARYRVWNNTTEHQYETASGIPMIKRVCARQRGVMTAERATVRRLDCRDNRFYGRRRRGSRLLRDACVAVYAVESMDPSLWTWDVVRGGVIGLVRRQRWSGEDWLKAAPDRVNWKDHFVCSARALPVGRRCNSGWWTHVFRRDAGRVVPAKNRGAWDHSRVCGQRIPGTFWSKRGRSWQLLCPMHSRDNAGRVAIMKVAEKRFNTTLFKGTQRNRTPGSECAP